MDYCANGKFDLNILIIFNFYLKMNNDIYF